MSSLPNSSVSEAYPTREILHRASGEIQGQELSFNTDERYLLQPDQDGFIEVPSNALRIDAHYPTASSPVWTPRTASGNSMTASGIPSFSPAPCCSTSWIFGSRARGDADEYADMDVFIKVELINRALKERIRDIAWQVGFENYIVISPIIDTKDELMNTPLKSSPIVKAIEAEGIKL